MGRKASNKINPSAGGPSPTTTTTTTTTSATTTTVPSLTAAQKEVLSVASRLTPHPPVTFTDPTIAILPTLSPSLTSPSHPSNKSLTSAVVVSLTMPDLTLIASTIDGKKLANAKPFGDEGCVLSSKYQTTFGLFTSLKKKELKKSLHLSLTGLKQVCQDNLIIFSGDAMTIAGQLLLFSIIPEFAAIIDPSHIQNIIPYVALPSSKTSSVTLRGTSLDVYGTLLGLDACVRALNDKAPFVFTTQHLYYVDMIYGNNVDRVRLLENVMPAVLYWRMNNELNSVNPVNACCVCEKGEIGYFKRKFDAAWEMRAYTEVCAEVLDFNHKNNQIMYNAMMRMAKIVDECVEIFTPVENVTMTILPYNFSFDVGKVETALGGVNSKFLDVRREKLKPEIDTSLDSPWTTCVVVGIGKDGELAMNALQKIFVMKSNVMFAKDFSTASKLLTNNKETAGKGWMLMLTGCNWSIGQLKKVQRDYENLTKKYTQREEFMVICMCVQPRPTSKSPVEECVGASRFLSFAIEHIKLNIFADSEGEAVKFGEFALDEGNRDVFCPFAMYNYLSPYSNQLSLVELSRWGGGGGGGGESRFVNKKVMLAYGMCCGMTVEEGLGMGGLLEDNTRTWKEGMADRYGRQREKKDVENVGGEAFCYTLTSSMELVDFLYVVKDKCESAFPRVARKGNSTKTLDKIDKGKIDEVEWKAWMALMGYTLWLNVIGV